MGHLTTPVSAFVIFGRLHGSDQGKKNAFPQGGLCGCFGIPTAGVENFAADTKIVNIPAGSTPALGIASGKHEQ